MCARRLFKKQAAVQYVHVCCLRLPFPPFFLALILFFGRYQYQQTIRDANAIHLAGVGVIAALCFRQTSTTAVQQREGKIPIPVTRWLGLAERSPYVRPRKEDDCLRSTEASVLARTPAAAATRAYAEVSKRFREEIRSCSSSCTPCSETVTTACYILPFAVLGALYSFNNDVQCNK